MPPYGRPKRSSLAGAGLALFVLLVGLFVAVFFLFVVAVFGFERFPDRAQFFQHFAQQLGHFVAVHSPAPISERDTSRRSGFSAGVRSVCSTASVSSVIGI